MPASEFSLIYRLQTVGLDQLDGVASKTKQVDLASKYGSDSLKGFEAALKAVVASGQSYGTALEQLSRSQKSLGQDAANIARDIIANDRAMRASKEENARAAAAEAAAEQRAAEQILRARQKLQQEQSSSQARSQSQITRGAASLLGGGNSGSAGGAGQLALGLGAGAIGAGVATGVIAIGAALTEMTRSAAASAQQLQNLSNEFGVSAGQMFNLQSAARISGVELGTLGMAAHKLGDAIEEPGGAGKKTAQALSELGVSLHQNMGQALQDTIEKLAGIEDPAKRAQLAFELFGRSSTTILSLAENFKNAQDVMRQWGLSLDTNVQAKLVHANSEIEAMGIRLTLLKAQLAEKFVITVTGVGSAWNWLTQRSNASSQALVDQDKMHADYLTPPMPRAPGAPEGYRAQAGSKQQGTSLLSLVQDNSKEGLDDRIAAAKEAMNNATARAKADATLVTSGRANVSTNTLQSEREEVVKTRAEYEKLEAQKKKTGSVKIDPYSNALQSYQESAETSDLGPIGSAQRERDAFARRFAGTPHGIDAQRQSQLGYDERLGFDLNTGTLASGRGILGKIAQENAKSAMEEARRNEETMDTSGYQSMLGLKPIMGANGQPITPKNWNNDGKAFTDALRDKTKDLQDAHPEQQLKEFLREDNKQDLGAVKRQAGLVQSLRNANGTNTPGSEYGATVDLAQKEYQIRLDGINKVASEEDKITQIYQAQGDLLAQIDEARIKRSEQLAEKAQAQQKETGQFFSGWVSAAISGEPNATGNFLRSFGQQQFSKIVSNFAENSIGSLNKWTGLNKTGAMGTADNPNFLGKILKGTPLDFDASSKDNIKDATVDNTTATNKNTDALNNLMKGGSGSGSGSGADTSGLSSEGSTVSVRPSRGGGAASAVTSAVGSAGSIAHAIQSGNPSQILNSVMGLGKAFGSGGSGGGGSDYRNMSESMSATPMAFGGGSNAYSDMSLPGAYSGFQLPNLDSFSSGSGGSRASDANAPLGGDGLPLDSQLSLPTDTYGMNLSNASVQGAINSIKPDAVSAQGTLGAAQGFSASLGKAFGNFGSGAQSGLSGYGLQNLFNGSTSDQFGAAGVAGSIASMGGAVAGGTLQAISGFGQGGARGDIGGLAGIATAIAPFTGPAAPFIEAGAMGLNLIKSLFPDPRQERIKQEARTLVNQQYIQPAAHDYSFSATGDGGNTWSEGGGLSSGGNTSTTNNHFLIQASDAQSFYEAMKRDPNQLSQVILSGLSSASAGQLGALINYTAQYGGT